MHKLPILSVCLLMVFPLVARASNVDWTPDANDIARMESVLRLASAEHISPGTRPPEPLVKYARYYAGVSLNGHRMIRGVLIVVMPPYLATRPGISIVRKEDLPIVMDGGCAIINLLYDPAVARTVWIRCNGLA